MLNEELLSNSNVINLNKTCTLSVGIDNGHWNTYFTLPKDCLITIPYTRWDFFIVFDIYMANKLMGGGYYQMGHGNYREPPDGVVWILTGCDTGCDRYYNFTPVEAKKGDVVHIQITRIIQGNRGTNIRFQFWGFDSPPSIRYTP